MFPSDPLFYFVGFTTIFLIALGKGAFGGGLAMLGVPLLSLVMTPVEAVIVVAFLVALMDAFALGSFGPRTWSKPDLLWLLPGVLGGIALGYFFFAYVDPRIIALAIAIIVIAFAIDWFLRRNQAPRGKMPPQPGVAAAIGVVAGFTSFVAQAGGPPVALYLLRRGLDKSIYAGTQLALFTIGNFLRLIPFGILATSHPGTMYAALVLSPVVPLGVWFGKYLHDRLDQGRLFFWCYVILIVAAAKLLFDALRSFSI